MEWTQKRTKKGMGWIPQLPDHRDKVFVPVSGWSRRGAVELPVQKIPYLDQSRQGSCTGHGPTGPVMFNQQQQGEQIVVPSRAFIYYNARVTEGTQDQDSGATVRDAFDVIVNLGVPPDTEFPYDYRVWDQRPPDNVYVDATAEKAEVYEFVRYGHLRQAIASGYPFVYGATLYESWNSVGSDGVVPVPGPGEQVIGGHCFWAWSYNDGVSGLRTPPRHIGNRNSYSKDWGDRGDFYLPYKYFDMGLCSDFCVLRRIA